MTFFVYYVLFFAEPNGTKPIFSAQDFDIVVVELIHVSYIGT